MMTSIWTPTITRSSIEDARKCYQECNRKIEYLTTQIKTCDHWEIEKLSQLNSQLEQAVSEALAAMQVWNEAIAL